jgi:GDP-L-fucose synthase
MHKEDKIFVSGASGLVGSAIVGALQAKGYTNIIGSYQSRKPDPSLITDHSSLVTEKIDLTSQTQVADFFSDHQPSYVFLAAAKVGGIMANNTYRAEFIYQNLQIQNNIIHQSYKSGVKKLLFLGSTCIYPRECPQPMKEEYLLTAPLEYTNEPYAIAKIAGMKMCESYNLQYGTNFICVMPTNLYGPGDNFDLETSHVLPAILRKMHLAKCLEQGDWSSLRNDLNKRPVNGINGSASDETILQELNKHGISSSGPSLITHHSSLTNNNSSLVTVTIWGSGRPKREFLYSEDMAQASVFIMENVDFSDLAKGLSEVRNTHINIGSGEEISIEDLASAVKDVVGFEGELAFDATKPDGTPRKLTDVSKLHGLGWKHRTSLDQGIKCFYEWYLEI